MWFLKYFMWGTKPKGTKKKRDKRYYIKMALLAAAAIALVYGCSTCGDCTSNTGKTVVRVPSPVTDLSVVFVDGNAQLYWTDSDDYNFDHIEVSWDGGNPVTVDKGVERYRIPILAEGVEYRFTVRAVDKWGNKSDAAVSGGGKGFWQSAPAVSEGELSPSASAEGVKDNVVAAGIKGTPVAEQVTLSWINPDDSTYDYIEINYDPDGKTPIRVPKGVESRTLVNLTNDIEHTFYVAAVDSRGNRTLLRDMGLYISDKATAPDSFVGRASGNEIVLTWQDPLNAHFEHIEVVYSPGGEKPVVVDKGEQKIAFTGLSDVNDYEFSVYTVDVAGRRRPLNNVHLVTRGIPLFDGRDAGQTVVRGVPVAGQVILSWNDPAIKNLDHIAILFEPDGKDEPVIAEAGMGTRTIVGLADGREYSFLAYGVDIEGNNRVITGLRLTTPVLPQLVTRPVSGRVTLLWSDPRDPALSYIEISYTPGGETPVQAAKGREGYTFNGLSDDKEYEFTVTAKAATGNTYAIIARVIVPQLSVLTGLPVNRQLSLSWIDPVNIEFDRIEIVYSPGGERAQIVGKGLESRTFTNLTDNVPYTFTIYARDRAGNRYAVESPRFYDPHTTFLVHQEPVDRARVGQLTSLNWRTSNSAAVFGESTINTIAFGVTSNGTARWVAGGGEGKIAYSNDYGLNWTRVSDSTFGSYSVDTISYGNGRWVAVGRNGRIAWSANGIVWNTAVKTQTVNSNINTTAYGEGRWMAGGNDGVILTSEDNGITWRVISTDVFGRSSVNTMVYHGGRWMAGGAAGKIAWSDNSGASWTAVRNSTFGNSIVNVIIYDNERWMAAGYTQHAAWSGDGITWQTLERPFFILCLGSNGYRWMAGGQEGRMAWSANSGETWVTDEQGQNFFGTSWIQAAASGRSPNGGRRWLSGGQSGKIIFADERF